MEEKRCKKCGKILPLSEFNKRSSSEDGCQRYCRECQKEYYISKKQRSKETEENITRLLKVYSNPELAKFKPRELIAELKARGYSGELKYTQTITV